MLDEKNPWRDKPITEKQRCMIHHIMEKTLNQINRGEAYDFIQNLLCEDNYPLWKNDFEKRKRMWKWKEGWK